VLPERREGSAREGVVIMPRIRTGVVGLGEQAWTNLLPALSVLPEVEIVALCDTNPLALSRASAKYSASTYVNFNEMLEACEFDAVIVASTPDVHFRVLRAALTKGVACFVEKPPTASTE
jgi:predicted dehydrogenase